MSSTATPRTRGTRGTRWPGEVVEVTEHALAVRYGAYPSTAHPGRIAVEQAADVLRWEDVDQLTRPAYRPNYWTGKGKER